MYTIDDLIAKFTAYSNKFEAELLLDKEEYPDALIDDFNLPEAFLAILREIKDLKEKSE